MHKSNTSRRKLYILCCLITRPQNGGRGEGCLFEGGGAYFKFWPIGGTLIRGGGALIRGLTVWSFCPLPFPDPQHNIDVDSSKVDPLFQHCIILGEGAFGISINDFPIQNNASPVGILSSVQRSFGQDCRFVGSIIQRDMKSYCHLNGQRNFIKYFFYLVRLLLQAVYVF